VAATMNMDTSVRLLVLGVGVTLNANILFVLARILDR
jgi:hypothetical protein